MRTALAFKIVQPDPFFTAQRVGVGSEGERIVAHILLLILGLLFSAERREH